MKASFYLWGLLLGWLLLPSPRAFVLPPLSQMPAVPPQKLAQMSEEGFELGRYLFYDTILSADSSLSCASCHQQKFAFADNRPQSLGIGQQPTARNSQPLFNLIWSDRFFWDGRAKGLTEQIFHPVRQPDEMGLSWPIATQRLSSNPFYKQKFAELYPNQPIDSQLIAQTIAQFVNGLISYRSKYDSVILRKAFLTEEEYVGFELINDMAKGDCLHCHPTDAMALGTTFEFMNNGLDPVDSLGNYPDNGLGAMSGLQKDKGRFKVPSLRNLLLTAPYMHDGRFQSLEQVLDFYSQGLHPSPNIDGKMTKIRQGGARLTEDEKAKIIIFLRTMTDYELTKDQRYANPFK